MPRARPRVPPVWRSCQPPPSCTPAPPATRTPPGGPEERSRAQSGGLVMCTPDRSSLPCRYPHDLSYFQATHSRPVSSTRPTFVRVEKSCNFCCISLVHFEFDCTCAIQLYNPSDRPFSLCKLGSTRPDPSRLGSTPLPVRSLPGQTLSTRDLCDRRPSVPTPLCAHE